jgi:hypothetical protein
VTLTDGSWTNDVFLDIVVNVDYINVAINQVATSITSKGLIGYNTNAAPFQGLGFQYNGTNLMYEMGFMVGTSSNVRDMVRGATTPDVDLQSAVTVHENTPTVSDMDLEGNFSDAASAGPLPVNVHHYSYAWTAAPHDKYVIVKYVIRNTGASTLSNVYGGIFADWDIDASTYGSNKGDVDNTNRMGYCYCTNANGIYAGVKLLSNTPFNTYSIDNTNGGNGGVNLYDGYDNTEKYTTLSTARAQSGNTSPSGNDVCQVVSSGPFTIAAGDSVTIAFAILAGDDLTDLQSSAVDAQTMYDSNVPTSISIVDQTGSGLNVYPNPADHSADINYTMTESGDVNIALFDAEGRQVAEIAQGAHAMGTYRASINTAELAEGVYVVRMQTGNAITNRQLIITH